MSYKVGDKVRMTCEDGHIAVGTVTDIETHDGYEGVSIKWDEGNGVFEHGTGLVERL